MPNIESPEQMQYFFTVRANRYYQFAMSLYKGLRFKGFDHFQTFEKTLPQNEDFEELLVESNLEWKSDHENIRKKTV